MSDARPNIVFVMAEHFTPWADPNYYYPGLLDCPALNELAGCSTRFEHAHCNAPVCGPSRATFLTGLYVNRHQTYDNGSIIPAHIPTFASMLTAGGYQTVMCGRMHMHGPDQQHGFELRPSSEIINPLPCCTADMPGDTLPLRSIEPCSNTNFGETFTDSPIHTHDAYVTDRACDYLTNARDERNGNPFAMVVGYMVAHPGSRKGIHLKPLYEKYLAMDLPQINFTRDEYEQLPEHTKRLLHYKQINERIFDSEYHRHELASFLARNEYFDMQLARIMQTLKETGHDKDTYLFVTGDHGENMGRHGLWGKMNFYEQAQRLPFYCKAPGQTMQQTVTTPISLVDCFATLCDIADVEVDVPTDGQSILPLCDGSDATDRDDTIFSEYHGYLCPGGMYMVLKDGIKYNHYTVEPDELFDLNADPDENINQIDNPEYADRLHALQEKLAAIVDVESTEAAIRDYNAQRKATSRGLYSSATIGQQIKAANDRWRDELNEPWWDGGEYLAPHEPASVNPLGKK